MSTYTPVNTAEITYVETPVAKFAFKRYGPRGGTPIVLVHRFRATIDWWDPEFIDLLAQNYDVIVFDNIGIGYTDGEALTTVDGYAQGAIALIDGLDLPQVDLLGWSFGGVVAQAITFARPDLVRKLIVAGSGSGLAPGAPPISEKVLGIQAQPTSSREDMLFLFYPDTPVGRASGTVHFDRVEGLMAPDAPVVTEAAAIGQLQAIGATMSRPWDEVAEDLESVTQPVLYANGIHDVMIDAFASYSATKHLTDAKLVLYSDAGHAFLFQHMRNFTTEVRAFLDA